MTSKLNTEELKTKLGEYTEKTEAKTKELFSKHSHHYSNLDSWKRGLILIALALLLLFIIYQLTKSDPKLSTKKESQMEEKMLRQMAFFKKLRE